MSDTQPAKTPVAYQTAPYQTALALRSGLKTIYGGVCLLGGLSLITFAGAATPLGVLAAVYGARTIKREVGSAIPQSMRNFFSTLVNGTPAKEKARTVREPTGLSRAIDAALYVGVIGAGLGLAGVALATMAFGGVSTYAAFAWMGLPMALGGTWSLGRMIVAPFRSEQAKEKPVTETTREEPSASALANKASAPDFNRSADPSRDETPTASKDPVPPAKPVHRP